MYLALHIWQSCGLLQQMYKQGQVGGEWTINSLAPGQNGHHFADDILDAFLWMKNFGIFIKISLNFVLEGPIDNNPAWFR